MSQNLTDVGLSSPIWIAFLSGLKQSIDPDFVPEPLPGAELHYEKWLTVYAPHAARSPMGDFHKEAWEWFEALKPGTRPPAFIAPWSRGLGKSTTVALALARCAVKGTRKFAVYLSSTQVAANRHLANVAKVLERCGIEREVSKYKYSRGWSATTIKTSNGFAAIAVGLDAMQRGLNIDFARPDVVILDDIDSLNDSVDAVLKKIDILRNTIFPSASPDCAIGYFQNLIHANSILTQTLEGDLDMLNNRVSTRVVAAIEGFEYEEYPDPETGRTRYRITGGESSWAGKTLSDWQNDLDAVGLEAFLREYQHKVGVGGRLFAAYTPSKEGGDWHVVEPIPVSGFKRFWGSVDYGTNAPTCFLVFAEDQEGTIYVIGEWYKANTSSLEQTEAVLKLLEDLGLAWPADAKLRDGIWITSLEYIAFDWANTFPPENEEERKGEYPVEVWWRRGLPCVRAVKDRKAGWRTFNGWLKATAYDQIARKFKARFRIFRGCAPYLEKGLAKAQSHPRDPDELDPGFREDHAIDSARYGVMTPMDKPEGTPPPKARPAEAERHLPEEIERVLHDAGDDEYGDDYL